MCFKMAMPILILILICVFSTVWALFCRVMRFWFWRMAKYWSTTHLRLFWQRTARGLRQWWHINIENMQLFTEKSLSISLKPSDKNVHGVVKGLVKNVFSSSNAKYCYIFWSTNSDCGFPWGFFFGDNVLRMNLLQVFMFTKNVDINIVYVEF